jgi:hypothetical protein
MKRILPSVTLLLAVAASAAPVEAHATPRYRMVHLPSFYGCTDPDMDINARGQAVFHCTLGWVMVWDQQKGARTLESLIGRPIHYYTSFGPYEAHAKFRINDRGEVMGSTLDETGTGERVLRGFVASPNGELSWIEPPADYLDVLPTAIDGAGEVVGLAYPPEGSELGIAAFRWTRATGTRRVPVAETGSVPIPLAIFQGKWWGAEWGLPDSAGHYGLSPLMQAPGGPVQPYASIPDEEGYRLALVRSVNADGVISGGCRIGEDKEEFRACLVGPDRKTQVLYRDGLSRALEVNDEGTAVGYYSDGDGQRGYLYDREGFHDFADLVDWPLGEARPVESLTALNDQGMVGGVIRWDPDHRDLFIAIPRN